MKAMRELLVGMLTAIASIVIVMGGITLSLAQGQPVVLFPTIVLPTNAIPSTPTTLAVPNPTVLSGFGFGLTATLSPVPSSSPTEVVPTNCPPPKGWQQYVVPSGINLEDLAGKRGTTVDRLMEANCLVSQDLMPDIILYVPPLKPTHEPTHTERPDTDTPEPTKTTQQVTPVACGRPHGWSVYYVQSGDTLYHLGMRFNTTVSALQQGNCLGNSTIIYAGQRLYVPVSPTRTPTEIPTQAPPTPRKTNTRGPTTTPVPTNTPRPTLTPTRVPTRTFTPTDTPSLIPTNTFTFTPSTAPSFTPTDVPVSP
jgi:LysM repeat protein